MHTKYRNHLMTEYNDFDSRKKGIHHMFNKQFLHFHAQIMAAKPTTSTTR